MQSSILPPHNTAPAHPYPKVLPPAKNSLNFVQFVEALRHVATVLRISLNEVMEKMVIIQGPNNNRSHN